MQSLREVPISMLEELARVFERRAPKPEAVDPGDIDTELKRLDLAFRMGRYAIIREIAAAIRNAQRCQSGPSKTDSSVPTPTEAA